MQSKEYLENLLSLQVTRHNYIGPAETCLFPTRLLLHQVDFLLCLDELIVSVSLVRGVEDVAKGLKPVVFPYHLLYSVCYIDLVIIVLLVQLAIQTLLGLMITSTILAIIKRLSSLCEQLVPSGHPLDVLMDQIGYSAEISAVHHDIAAFTVLNQLGGAQQLQVIPHRLFYA